VTAAASGSGDSSALAACWEYGQRLSKGYNTAASIGYARTAAAQYASLNKVGGHAMTVDTNTSNNPSGDIVFGYVADFKNSQSQLVANSPNGYNAVKVRLSKNTSINGEVPYFFARIFGLTGQTLQEEATAGFLQNIKGFKAPADNSNVQILPYALDLQTWNNLIANSGTDNYRWNASTKKVEAGSDGLVEVNLFPQGTGAPGNRGTVDIGSSNNSHHSYPGGLPIHEANNDRADVALADHRVHDRNIFLFCLNIICCQYYGGHFLNFKRF